MRKTLLLFLLLAAASMFAAETEPPVITPGHGTEPPSDAIVLFDGKDLSKWRSVDHDGPAKWDVKDGYVQVNGTGSVRTKDEFADV